MMNTPIVVARLVRIIYAETIIREGDYVTIIEKLGAVQGATNIIK